MTMAEPRYAASGLGDVIWPPFPFLFAPNLTGRLADIKRRGMQLMDISQYLPGDTGYEPCDAA